MDVFTIHDIARVFGLRRTASYALTREPGFPSPLRGANTQPERRAGGTPSSIAHASEGNCT